VARAEVPIQGWLTALGLAEYERAFADAGAFSPGIPQRFSIWCICAQLE
jgi:hypothetical protein